MHIQHVVSGQGGELIESDEFRISQVRNDFRVLVLASYGNNYIAAMAGGTQCIQKPKVLMMVEDFDITHLIVLPATAALYRGH
jgi:hypothetical protein